MGLLKIGDLTTRYPWVFAWTQYFILLNYRKIKQQLSSAFPGNLQGKSCLDIGCGVGGLFPYFEGRGMDYTGIDVNSRYLDYARKKHGNRFHLSGAGEIQKLGRKFDIILINDVIHHLSDEEAASSLAQAAQILNPGGRLFIHDALPAPRENRVGSFIQAQDATSERFRDLDTLKALFQASFEISSFQRFHIWPIEYIVFILTPRE